MRNIKAFTLIELMVVILIVGILAAASIPLMRGRIDSAKWAEANATAGTIRSAVRVAYAEGTVEEGDVLGLGTQANRDTLGFAASDLQGTYFDPSMYSVTVGEHGIGVVTVTGGSGDAPPGSATLSAEGVWTISH